MFLCILFVNIELVDYQRLKTKRASKAEGEPALESFYLHPKVDSVCKTYYSKYVTSLCMIRQNVKFAKPYLILNRFSKNKLLKGTWIFSPFPLFFINAKLWILSHII